jgi:hypothetical protein
MDEPPVKPNLLQRLVSSLPFRQEKPASLNLERIPPKPSEPKRSAAPPVPAVPPRQRFPGNFFSFKFCINLAIGDQVWHGVPVHPITDPLGKLHWGSQSEEFLFERLPWLDDPVKGVNCRVLENIEDVLGAEGGMSPDLPLRFESILDVRKNTIVFALFNPTKGIRVAYSFPRRAFQKGYIPPSADRPDSATTSADDKTGSL